MVAARQIISNSTKQTSRDTILFRTIYAICKCVVFLFFSGYRADNFIVGLTDVSPAITAPTLWNYDLCAQYPGVVGDGATVYLPCTSCVPPRRYLIVQYPITEYLNFCEIEVYVGRK